LWLCIIVSSAMVSPELTRSTVLRVVDQAPLRGLKRSRQQMHLLAVR